jgi:hypothetical protein
MSEKQTSKEYPVSRDCNCLNALPEIGRRGVWRQTIPELMKFSPIDCHSYLPSPLVCSTDNLEQTSNKQEEETET